jgi:hypothetical protein
MQAVQPEHMENWHFETVTVNIEHTLQHGYSIDVAVVVVVVVS